MQTVFIVVAESDDGNITQIVSVYFNKEKAEAEAKEIQLHSDLIAYVEEKDVTE